MKIILIEVCRESSLGKIFILGAESFLENFDLFLLQPFSSPLFVLPKATDSQKMKSLPCI